MRIETSFIQTDLDARASHVFQMLSHSYYRLKSVEIIDFFIMDDTVPVGRDEAEAVFCDTVVQQVRLINGGSEDYFAAERTWDLLLEIMYKPGVTDPVGMTAHSAVDMILSESAEPSFSVHHGVQYLLAFDQGEAVPEVASALYNKLIQQAVMITGDEWKKGVRPPTRYEGRVSSSPAEVETIDILDLTVDQMTSLSEERLLALSPEEMSAIQSYFRQETVQKQRSEAGLGPEPTDVELEMIAQTWSEHCKHKIFNARIDYRDGNSRETITSLFSTYIKRVTDILTPEKDFLKSVFHDNSGVIQFDDETCLCFKAETHNSPSALDPYGGAITGIVGVNRDIMGTGIGARPLFNTNVLCFGPQDTPAEDLPPGLLHPRQVMRGVHQGIIDGGNQSGIPVAAGAFLFDDSYLGKPLVFCGTGGILPSEVNGEPSWIKHIDPGDKAVMVGGRIGKDGIHGATFSSQELSETSPTSAVQIGDPITQKKMADFLLEARDLGLYKGITDNGAGGLSSSLGEMAEESGGIRIDLDLCPLKYPGLAAWEILVSESQERMSLSVDPGRVEQLLELAQKRDVEVTVVGEFTDTGYIEVFYHGEAVVLVSLDFLHSGVPVMELSARWEPPVRTEAKGNIAPVGRGGEGEDCARALLAILADPNVASKEPLIRQYDHEVQAVSVGKPMCGVFSDAPSDGAVLKPRYDSFRGITVTHGICPRYSDIDTYHMAFCAVDEALRAHVACGGDPDQASALDNFCWPDPVVSDKTPDGEYKLAQLVRACRGLFDACFEYKIPLISGKDSMKNDARLGEKKVSVRPTLLVSLMGIVPDIRFSVSADFKRAGDIIFILGETRDELGGTRYEEYSGVLFPRVPTVNSGRAMKRYRTFHQAVCSGLISSCHDLSDGGLAAACAESALGGRLGADIDLDRMPVDGGERMSIVSKMFSETPSRFIVTVPADREEEFSALFTESETGRLGTVTHQQRLRFLRGGKVSAEVGLDAVESSWKSAFREEGTGNADE